MARTVTRIDPALKEALLAPGPERVCAMVKIRRDGPAYADLKVGNSPTNPRHVAFIEYVRIQFNVSGISDLAVEVFRYSSNLSVIHVRGTKSGLSTLLASSFVQGASLLPADAHG